MDGTLGEAWAGLKSFKRKDGSDGQISPDDPGNPTVNFHGEKRSNDTYQGRLHLVRIRNLTASTV